VPFRESRKAKGNFAKRFLDRADCRKSRFANRDPPTEMGRIHD